MTIISSAQNPTIKHAHALLTNHRTRKKSMQTVLEGVHLLTAYLDKGLAVDKLVISETAIHHPEIAPIIAQMDERAIITITDKLYKDIRTLGDGVDVMAIIDVPTQTLSTITDDCLILNGVQDAGNAGTLLRSASSVGISTIISTTGSASLWSPKCLRAGMGAQFSLTIIEQVSTDALLSSVKTPLYATSSHVNKVIYDHDLTGKVAWVLGHEGQGVEAAILNQATAIALPQPGGQESLNVGVAGSICFYEMLRQRQYQT